MSIVRRSRTVVDVLILGDSPVYVAHNGKIDRLSDNRLARLGLPSRTRLLERLAAGHGYDDHRHKELACQMPGEKAPYRNRSGGYWIAEADVQAARTPSCTPIPHTTSRGVPCSPTEWTTPPPISASPWKA